MFCCCHKKSEHERKIEQAAKEVGKDLAELVLKEAAKVVKNKDLKEKLSTEGVSTIKLLEDVARLAVDAAKLILKDKEGIKETAKLILKEAIKEAVLVVIKEAVELIVKEEAKIILKELEKKIDPHSASKPEQGITHWIDKHVEQIVM